MTEKQVKRAIERAYQRGIHDAAGNNLTEEHKAFLQVSQVIAYEMFMNYCKPTIKDGANPYYKMFVDIWYQKYPDLLTMPVDGHKIKSIIKKTIDYLQKHESDLRPERPLQMWTWFVANLHKSKFYHNKNLSKIESAYIEIVIELMGHGTKSTNHQQERTATREWARSH